MYKRLEEASRRILILKKSKNEQMKNLKYITLVLAIIMMSSCTKEDSITITDNTSLLLLNQSVSGTVFIDTDKDWVGDDPFAGAKVYLGDHDLIMNIIGVPPDSFEAPFNEILWTEVDRDGLYSFESIMPVESASLVLYTPQIILDMQAKDDTPDGDLNEEELNTTIDIAVLEDEKDDGNNFIVQLKTNDGRISGYVMVDTDNDGTADSPEPNVRIKLSRANSDGNPESGTLSLALEYTNNDGYFEFNTLESGQYVVIMPDVSDYSMLSSGDLTPDQDPVLPPSSYWIPVNVVDNEHDTDNNFNLKYKTTNSGYVLEDTDGDGVGDVGLNLHRIELYKRNSTGVPTSTLIAASYSDPTGHYKFTNVPAGDYVIYYIGDPNYTCVNSADETPEVGEPTNNQECFFIQMDVPTDVSEDSDNVFVVKKI